MLGRRALILCGLCCLLALACEPGAPDGSRAHGDPLAAARDTAARRGIAWLADNHAKMGPTWTFAIFSYLYPIVADPALAATCGALRDEASRVPFLSLKEAFRDPHPLRLATLQPTVAELLRRKWAGEPWEDAALVLQVQLRERADGFWKHVPLGQQAVLLHGFSVLDIDAKRTLDDLVRELRATWSEGDPEALLVDPRFMFGLTHVFYAASGYFTHYPAADGFGPELEILRRALRRYLAAPVPPEGYFLDVQAEVLVALALLRAPEDDDVHAMHERLLGLQNPDGSWGERDGIDRYHATVVAVQALLDFPDEFRGR
jgi:hypothetical protein